MKVNKYCFNCQNCEYQDEYYSEADEDCYTIYGCLLNKEDFAYYNGYCEDYCSL